MKFDSIDSDNVNTQSILSDIIGERTRLEQKQIDLTNAVKSLSTFWSRSTPRFTDPILDDENNIIENGKPIEILYQFHPDNQDEFIDNASIIDSAFAIVLEAIKEIYQELYETQKTSPVPQFNKGLDVPQNLTYNIEAEKKGWLGNVFNKIKEPDRDSPYYKMEKYMSYLKLVEDIWLHIREHQEKSVAGVGVNFTMASRRKGMEARCGIYRQYFLAWVKPGITKMMEYVIEKRIREITQYNIQILQFQASVQQRHEKLQM